MSRHVIPNAPGSPDRRKTVVGWDAPLNTFFASASEWVPDSGDDEYGDDVELWAVGETLGEIPSLPRLSNILAAHGVDLPIQVAQCLSEDYQREGDQSQGRPASGLIAALAAHAKGGAHGE